MRKFAIILLVLFVLVLFAINNMEHVELGLIIGRPMRIRLFFLLMLSFLAGCLTMSLVNMYFNAKFRKLRELEAKPENARAAKGSDDEVFF